MRYTKAYGPEIQRKITEGWDRVLLVKGKLVDLKEKIAKLEQAVAVANSAQISAKDQREIDRNERLKRELWVLIENIFAMEIRNEVQKTQQLLPCSLTAANCVVAESKIDILTNSLSQLKMDIVADVNTKLSNANDQTSLRAQLRTDMAGIIDTWLINPEYIQKILDAFKRTPAYGDLLRFVAQYKMDMKNDIKTEIGQLEALAKIQTSLDGIKDLEILKSISTAVNTVGNKFPAEFSKRFMEIHAFASNLNTRIPGELWVKQDMGKFMTTVNNNVLTVYRKLAPADFQGTLSERLDDVYNKVVLVEK